MFTRVLVCVMETTCLERSLSDVASPMDGHSWQVQLYLIIIIMSVSKREREGQK